MDNLVCLGGNTGRVRLDMESLGNRIGTEEYPFCLGIVETPFANLSEERRHRNVPPSRRDLVVETRARILSRIGLGVKVD